jgi:hypothetical protein
MNKKNNYIYYAIETQDFRLKDNPEDLTGFWSWDEVDRAGHNLEEAEKKYEQLSKKYNTLRLVQVEFTALKIK